MNNSIIKKLYGVLIFFSGYYYLFSFLKKKKVTVLMYHRISKEIDNIDLSKKKKFEEQMGHLSENYNVITFDKLVDCYKTKKKIPRNSVIITFDDGYKDNYEIAYPILKKYKLPATIFLTTGHINNNELFWWDKIAYIINKTKIKKFTLKEIGTFSLVNKERVIREIQEKFKKVDEGKKDYLIDKIAKKLRVNIPKKGNTFLSWNNVREMSKNNISFGAHTVTHPILTRISLKQAKDEIMNSKKKIENEINKQVSVFAYPNGTMEDMSGGIDEFLKENGFFFANSTIYGTNNLKKNLFRLKRVGIESEDDLRLFRIKLLGIGKMLEPIYSRFFK